MAAALCRYHGTAPQHMRVATCLVLATIALGALDHEQVRKDAQVAVKAERLVPARNALKKALAELRKTEQKPTQAAADLLNDLGSVYERLGQEAERIAALDESAGVLLALHGPADPRYAMALDKLGDAHAGAEQHAEAATIFNNVLNAMRKGLGSNHPGYEFTLGKAANSALQSGKAKQAVKAYRELLERGETSATAKDDASVGGLARVVVQYSIALAKTGKLEDALAQAIRAEKLFAGSGLAGSIDHAASCNGVAGVLERLNRDDEAIAAMTKALEITRASEDVHTELVKGAQRNLNGLKRQIDRKRKQQGIRDEL